MPSVTRAPVTSGWWCGLATFLVLSACTARPAAPPAAPPAIRVPRAGFEANLGQWPAAARLAARDGDAVLLLTDREAIWRVADGRDLRLRWLGGAMRAPQGEGRRAARLRYARGAQRFDVPLYDRVVYRQVYPGIDLIFHDQRGHIEYDFVVAPGADPTAIRLAIDGATLEGEALVVARAGGRLVHHAPLAFQDGPDGRRTIASRYAVRDARDATTVGFALAAYDRSRPLVIDPHVTYSTAIDQQTDSVAAIAVDAAGNLWLAGSTNNAAFPITDDAADDSYSSFDDGYVVKLDADGELVYATYLGGSGLNCVGDLVVDEDGNAYLAGTTTSTDFPLSGPFQPAAPGGGGDGFLVKLDADGRLVASTYFGGEGYESCPGRSYAVASLALAPDDGLYGLIGATNSMQFVGFGESRSRIDADGLLARFDRDLRPAWARFVGGTTGDQMTRVGADADGNAYVAGYASRTLGNSHDFATTPGAFQPTTESDLAWLLSKYDAEGDLAYATFLTATEGDSGARWYPNLAVGPDGTAYVAVLVGSTAMPATAGALRTTPAGNGDAFVFAVRPDGSGLRYGTYLGGTSEEQAYLTIPGIALAADGRLALGLATFSSDFPLRDAVQTVPTNSVVAVLSADGSALTFATYLGQAAQTVAHRGGALYVGGRSAPPDNGLGALRIAEGPAPCDGDCDADGTVRVNELVTGVRIALGELAADACAGLDADDDGSVSIAELIGAVGRLLGGC